MSVVMYVKPRCPYCQAAREDLAKKGETVAHGVATMTGNLVFLGLAAAGAHGFAVGTSALAIGGFIVGVLIGGRVLAAARSHRGRALRNVLGVKLTFAVLVAVVAILTGPHFTHA